MFYPRLRATKAEADSPNNKGVSEKSLTQNANVIEHKEVVGFSDYNMVASDILQNQAENKCDDP